MDRAGRPVVREWRQQRGREAGHELDRLHLRRRRHAAGQRDPQRKALRAGGPAVPHGRVGQRLRFPAVELPLQLTGRVGLRRVRDGRERIGARGARHAAAIRHRRRADLPRGHHRLGRHVRRDGRRHHGRHGHRRELTPPARSVSARTGRSPAGSTTCWSPRRTARCCCPTTSPTDWPSGIRPERRRPIPTQSTSAIRVAPRSRCRCRPSPTTIAASSPGTPQADSPTSTATSTDRLGATRCRTGKCSTSSSTA